jgi:hypothetical protein
MNAPLQIYYSPDGYFDPETGERSPLWSASDAHSPARTLKQMTEVLLETGWSLSTLVRVPGEEEPIMLSALYKAQHEGKFPRNFAAFQREAKARDYMASNRDPYRTGLPDAALGGGKRSDYGTSGPGSGPFGSWMK